VKAAILDPEIYSSNCSSVYFSNKEIYLLKAGMLEPGRAAHVHNPSTWEPERGGSQVPGQTELHRETLSPKIKAKTQKTKIV
jgi:hypothetical protein